MFQFNKKITKYLSVEHLEKIAQKFGGITIAQDIVHLLALFSTMFYPTLSTHNAPPKSI